MGGVRRVWRPRVREGGEGQGHGRVSGHGIRHGEVLLKGGLPAVGSGRRLLFVAAVCVCVCVCVFVCECV